MPDRHTIMETGQGALVFPLPWASGPAGSSVSSPDAYCRCLEAAGFDVVAERDRRDFALEFFARFKAKLASAGGPPPLGLHVLMGESAPVKYGNMIECVSRGLIAPVELIAEKRA